MDIINVETLSFGQLLLLIGIASVLSMGIIILLSKLGFRWIRRKNMFAFGKDNDESGVSLMVVLDAINTKDDIYRIDNTVFLRQCKYVKEKCEVFRQHLVSYFRDLTVTSLNIPISELPVHKDYLYFLLLSDRLYHHIVGRILEDIEENGLSSKSYPEEYAKSRAKIWVAESKDMIDNFYYGIDDIDKDSFNSMWTLIQSDLLDILKDIYSQVIRISIKGAEKKKEYRDHLYEKVKGIDGITEKEFRKLFAPIHSSDFLDI